MTGRPTAPLLPDITRHTTTVREAVAYLRDKRLPAPALMRLCDEANVRPARSMEITYMRIARAAHPHTTKTMEATGA